MRIVGFITGILLLPGCILTDPFLVRLQRMQTQVGLLEQRIGQLESLRVAGGAGFLSPPNAPVAGGLIPADSIVPIGGGVVSGGAGTGPSVITGSIPIGGGGSVPSSGLAPVGLTVSGAPPLEESMVYSPPGVPLDVRRAFGKLGRGLVNLITGWVEIPERMVETSTNSGAGAGLTLGLLRGTGYGFVRTAAGAYEIVTFPFPAPSGYRSVIRPEYVFTCEDEDPLSSP